MTCRDAEDLLHDALDRALDPVDAAALAAHLETCAACRDLQADLALVRHATDGLDRPILPADGWTKLSARLEAEGLLTPAASVARPAGGSARWYGYAWVGLAATLLVGVGSAIVWRAGERGPGPAPLTPVAGARAPDGNARAPHAVEVIETELRIAAAHYEKAITALEGLAAEDRSRLDPAVAQVVARNLVLIDQAIADSRTALRGQPGSLMAQASLFDAYRRKVTLLQDVIALASEVQRSGSDGAARRDRAPS